MPRVLVIEMVRRVIGVGAVVAIAVLVAACAPEPSKGTVTARSHVPSHWSTQVYRHRCGDQTCTSTRRVFVPDEWWLTVRPSSGSSSQFKVHEWVYAHCHPGDEWTMDPNDPENGTCHARSSG
ncbi:MAG: hypothetical protein J2P58_12850 [Acidimicrobiaceae bacterium]|nr:hypothetical protein [Acidimicrobiaceae bacterium]